MKITVTWSGTDADRVQAQAAQSALEAAGLSDSVEYVIEARQPQRPLQPWCYHSEPSVSSSGMWRSAGESGRIK